MMRLLSVVARRQVPFGWKATKGKEERIQLHRRRKQKRIENFLTIHNGEADEIVSICIHIELAIHKVRKGDIMEVIIITSCQHQIFAVFGEGQGLHSPLEIEFLQQGRLKGFLVEGIEATGLVV